MTSCLVSNLSCTYSLPTGVILAGKNDVMSLTPADGERFASVAFPHTVPIMDIFVFIVSNKTGAPVLLESSLNLCVQSYNISVSNGKASTALLNSWHALNTSQNLVVEVPGSNSTFKMGDASYNSLAIFLRTIFNGTYTIENGIPTYGSGTGSDVIQVLADTLFIAPWDEAAMANFLLRLATSMTNA